MSCRWLGQLVLASLLLSASQGAASDRFVAKPIAVYEGSEAGLWDRVELLQDTHPGFKRETYPPQGVQQDPWIIKWFQGEKGPHSGMFLLHCARGWRAATRTVPVLLVHGACDNANRAWIHPYDKLLTAAQRPHGDGFASRLAKDGHAVFAVTFAHPQGDNFMQAEALADALVRIRSLLGRDGDPKFQVDVVAHSKGGVAARLHCSDARKLYPAKEFLTPYGGGVRRLVAIGSPMLGIDTPFRYYMYNLWVEQDSHLNAPMGTDRLMVWGSWVDTTSQSVFTDKGNPFPGQCQMLYDLAGKGIVALAPDSFTVDANFTMSALYKGGTTPFLKSRGIAPAIEQGERLIYKLDEAGLDPRISLGVVAGKNPVLDVQVAGLSIPVFPNPLAPPADGVVFVASATATKGSLRRGAKLLGTEVLDLNHLDLARTPVAFAALETLLDKPSRRETAR